MNRRQRGAEAQRRGRWAERLCVLALCLKGYSILAHGHVTGRGTGAGEIDIIARRGRVLAFIEVKARPSLEDAAAALTPGQCRRLTRAAAGYLGRQPDLSSCQARFDVMLVVPWRWPRHLMDAWRETI